MTKLVSEEGGFSVLMPGAAQFETKPVTFAGSAASSTLNVYTVDVGDDVTFAAGYNDVPAGAVTGTPREILAQIEAQSVRGRALVSDNPIRQGGSPGRHFKATKSEGSICEAKIYLCGRRLYEAIVGAAADK